MNYSKPINQRKFNQNLIAIIILIFITSSAAQAQFRLNKTDSFNFGLVLDPGASIKEKGLNFGIELEYVGTVYTRATITSFTKLNGGYLDAVGSFGINFTSGYFEQFRYYSGVRLGLIRRSNNTYPLAGLETGIDYKITDKLLLGLRLTYDKRSDFEFYNESPEMRVNGFIKVGFIL